MKSIFFAYHYNDSISGLDEMIFFDLGQSNPRFKNRLYGMAKATLETGPA